MSLRKRKSVFAAQKLCRLKKSVLSHLEEGELQSKFTLHLDGQVTEDEEATIYSTKVSV